jgi:hypothetical protein
MRTLRALTYLLALTGALLAGCAGQPTTTQAPTAAPAPAVVAPPVRLTEEQAHARLQLGVQHYKENNLDLAQDDFDAASSSGHLKNSEMIVIHKYMAFIHCAKGREAQCREQFQGILKIDPKYELTPNEGSNPAWSAVWRSIRGTADDNMAVAQGSVAKATPGQQKMAEGIKEYDAGNYPQALVSLQMALDKGLQNKTDQIRTHKYLAFANCLKNDAKQCRAEFHAIFGLDRKFQLSPSEAGHPAWTKIYKDELALAKNPATPTTNSATKSTGNSAAPTPAATPPAPPVQKPSK